MRRALLLLRRDCRGVAAIEFALVAPVFLLMMLGIFDLGQMVYGKIELNGVVQEAARSSSLESSNTAKADAQVEAAVKTILPGAQVDGERISYYDFADVGRPEKWNDGNKNGECDNGESFVDENRNGAWDEDVGIEDSNGGAGDVVLYRVTVKYDPVFPVPFWGMHNGQRQITAVAIKKNQPFAFQQAYGSSAGKCT